MKRFLASGALFVVSRALALAPGAVEMQVPHGHNHTSELTHARIGAALGQRILESE